MHQPEELKSVKQQIDAAHNQLLTINNEFSRVQSFKRSEEIQLADLQGLKSDLTESVNVTASRGEKESLTKDIEQLRKMLVSVNDDSEKRREEIAKQLVILDEKSDALDSKEKSLSEIAKHLEKEQKIVERKHNKIKELVNEL